MKKLFFAVATAALVCGCWTFGKSEYPAVATTSATGNASKLMLAVNGYETVVSSYEVMHGYSTVFYPGYCGRHCYYPGYYGVEPTFAAVRCPHASDMFLKRARELFDDAGFSQASGSAVPDYTVEVNFGGPMTDSGDVWKSVAWMVCTAFLCDYDAVEWSAKLRIRDNRTGKIVFKHDYVQRYESNAFGLIPLFSIGSCEELQNDYEQGWCLAALTDRTVADATAFLAALPPPKGE